MDIRKISKEYFSFIEKNTHFNFINNNLFEVITPFVDSFGEGISFVIEKKHRYIKVHDQGFTLWNLSNYGIDLLNKNSARHKSLLSLLNYSGFKEENGYIFKNTSNEDLPQTIHDMTQLLINVYDFALTSKQRVANFFFDDVKNYFSDHKQYYSYFPDFLIQGKSRISHKIDFVFLKKEKSNLVKVYNKLDKQNVNNILVSWLDTVDKRHIDYGLSLIHI